MIPTASVLSRRAASLTPGRWCGALGSPRLVRHGHQARGLPKRSGETRPPVSSSRWAALLTRSAAPGRTRRARVGRPTAAHFHGTMTPHVSPTLAPAEKPAGAAAAVANSARAGGRSLRVQLRAAIGAGLLVRDLGPARGRALVNTAVATRSSSVGCVAHIDGAPVCCRPDNYPSVSSLDWTTGEPNAKFARTHIAGSLGCILQCFSEPTMCRNKNSRG